MQRGYYIATALYCALIFWLSNQSNPPMPEMRFPGEDKVAHMVLYGGLAGILSLGLHRSGRNHAPWVLKYGPVLFAVLYGLTDEVHQLFIAERTFSLLDLVADAAGAALVHGACSRYFQRYPVQRPAPADGT
jgi:VanZ family protein